MKERRALSKGARLNRAIAAARDRAYEERGQVLVELWCSHPSHARGPRHRARLGEVYETSSGRLLKCWQPASPTFPLFFGLDQLKRDHGKGVPGPRFYTLHFLDRPPWSDLLHLLERDVEMRCRDHGTGSVGIPLLRERAAEAQRSGKKERVGVLSGECSSA